MKFKLDENFGARTKEVIAAAGHDVHTVFDEQLQGSDDATLLEHCVTEERCLITLDLDFADVLRFPPGEAHGIVVVRVPRNPTLKTLERLIHSFLEALKDDSMRGRLWIVETGRIRIHQTQETE